MMIFHSLPMINGYLTIINDDVPYFDIIYIYMGKFHYDLTVLPHWKSWFISKGNHPQMGRKIQVSEIL